MSTIVFTDVPRGDYRLTTTTGINVSEVHFTDATGATAPYEGLGLHPTGGDPLVVTLFGTPPPPATAVS